ncbi:MAG: hypothetical protein FGM54_02725 [Chitinophagaceae bacterium]|nr:hypothetical protein [Chitinophagaceae bacterium]
MCFSATASFSSSIFIAGVAAVALRRSTLPNEKPLALIPVLFAVQQAIEGFIWLGWKDAFWLPWQSQFSAWFLFFAWMVWPVLVPLAAWKIEPRTGRKKTMFYFLLIGMVLAFIAFFQIVLASPYPIAVNHRISYQLNALQENGWVRIVLQSLYVLVTLLPLLLSSIRGLLVLGITNAMALLISFLFFQEALPSVWCFFAALLSGLIAYMIPIKYQVSQ